MKNPNLKAEKQTKVLSVSKKLFPILNIFNYKIIFDIKLSFVWLVFWKSDIFSKKNLEILMSVVSVQ